MVCRSRLETSRISCSSRLRSVMFRTLIEMPVPIPASRTRTARFSKYLSSPLSLRLEFVCRGLPGLEHLPQFRDDHGREHSPAAAAEISQPTICSIVMPPMLWLMKRMRRSVSTSISISAVLAVVVRSSCSERRNCASDSRRARDILGDADEALRLAGRIE